VTLADRARIEELLAQDPPPSCRAISRVTGISDWTCRRVKRELDGDPRPMKRGSRARSEPTDELAEPLGLGGWIMFALVAGGIALAAWAGVRWTPPMDT
jgi:hypothetical protein